MTPCISVLGGNAFAHTFATGIEFNEGQMVKVSNGAQITDPQLGGPGVLLHGYLRAAPRR